MRPDLAKIQQMFIVRSDEHDGLEIVLKTKK